LREHRAEIERRLSWLHWQRFRFDVRSQVRARSNDKLDRIDEKIAC
jgi:hypothetical protein